MRIINLTQHVATPEQAEAGVIEPVDKDQVRTLLTIDTLPCQYELMVRADMLAAIAASSGCKHAMIGGAPYMMRHIEDALHRRGILPMYAFSRRVSDESLDPAGAIVKTSKFVFDGWI